MHALTAVRAASSGVTHRHGRVCAMSSPQQADGSPAGTVLAPGSSLILVPSVAGFQLRSTDPAPGLGYQVQGAYVGSVSATGGLQLTDASGGMVANNAVTTPQTTAG